MSHEVITEHLVLQKHPSQEFRLFDSGVMRMVCREIINGECYQLLPEDVIPAESVKTIFDVGANVGAACIFFLDCYQSAKVYAYEPCLEAYGLLVENTARLQVEPYNVALGAEDGFVRLYHGIEGDVCNNLKNHKCHGHELVVMEQARRHIKEPIDILKLDTEGCELQILSDIEAWLKDIRVIYVEYHSEDARHRIDRVLKATHTLWSSSAVRPHRGQLCYLRTCDIPLSYADWAIE